MSKEQYQGFMETSPLWKGELTDIQQFVMPIVDLRVLETELIPGRLRLGHQMEQVFKQLIDHSDDYKVLIHNLPIRKEKITLGEIDFIIQHTGSGKLIHVELAYKFYIIDTSIADPIRSLIGPNRKDRFYDKLQKIKNKQMPLLHTAEGAEVLLDHNIDHQDVEHQCCFKAQLFYPYNSKIGYIGELNKDCLKGDWLRMDEFSNDEFRDSQYYIPPKSEWVVQPHEDVLWKPHSDIIINVNESLGQERAPMIWQKDSNNKIRKRFIVWW